MIDLNLVAHKYSDYYDGFKIYDARKVFYPIFKIKVNYRFSEERPLHPALISILKIIKSLNRLKNIDIYKEILSITQLDIEILDSILADLNTKGYLKIDNLELSSNGLEMLQNEKEKVIESGDEYIYIDGIFGRASKFDFLKHKPDKNSLEFKPLVRPRERELDDEFAENKTLRQVLIENLSKENIETIENIGINKFFEFYYCIFYKDIEDGERILALNSRYEIDRFATQNFEDIIEEQKFSQSIKESSEYQKNIEKFESAEISDEINLDNSHTIDMLEHKEYFIYVLKNAKKQIYIQSPWIKHNVVEIYKKYFQEAIKRKVKICIKYGMKPRNKNDKPCIDEESLEILKELKCDLIESHDHSKVLICDDEFMIMGSFNWLSYSGNDDDRGETSTINTNKQAIKKEIEKFKKMA